MATTRLYNPSVSDQVRINALGIKYEVTGLVAAGEAAPTDKTQLIINMPSGFNYKGDFVFSANENLSNPITPDSITGTDVITVTLSNNLLTQNTDYYLTFTVQYK